MNEGEPLSSPQSTCRAGTRARWRSPQAFWLLATLYCVVVIVVRVPLLVNAAALFNDDESANALSIKHLVEGRAPLLFYYGQRYQGLTEGIIALPFVLFFGWTPLAFISSPLLAWTVANVLVARWLWDRWGAAWATAWFALQSFVPVLSLWASTQAHGGHVWVVTIAIASFFLCSWELKGTGRWGAFAGLQFLGCYTYSYYVLFLPLTCLAAVRASGWRRVRNWIAVPLIAGGAAAAVVGLRAVADRIQPDRNCYPDFWRLEQQVVWKHLGDRWFVLRRQCLPLAFSAEGACHPFTRLNAAIWLFAVGESGLPPAVDAFSRYLFRVQIALFLVGTVAALVGLVRNSPRSDFASLVVLSGAAACVAFVLFRYGEQWSRVRYLIPVFPAASLAALWAARFLWLRFRTTRRKAVVQAALMAGLLTWMGYYAYVDVAYYRIHGMIGPSWTPLQIQSFRTALVDWCRANGMAGMLGYADYRLAYPVAFLTGEQVRLCPYDLRRIPSYAAEADALESPWFFGLELGPRATPPEVSGIQYKRRAEIPCPPFRVVVWEPMKRPSEGNAAGR